MHKPGERNHRAGLDRSELDDDLQELCNDIQLPDYQPSEQLRQGFYRQLGAHQSKRGWRERLWDRLSWLRQPALASAMSLVVGLLIGSHGFSGGQDETQQQLQALESQVAGLNSSLAINLMQNAAIGDRLSGIELAADLQSQQVDRALLIRARDDRSQSVRSAALAALGPRINQDEVWQEIESLLVNSQSELVQLAVVDLILRFGSSAQVRHLAQVTQEEKLLPEINQYASSKMEQVTI